jgi:hypothetical protein
MDPRTLVRRLGVRGTLKSVYHSYRHSDSPSALVFHSNVVTDIAPATTFDIGNRFEVGVSNPGASHPRVARSAVTTATGSSVTHAGTEVARIGPGSIVHVEGDFEMGDSYINSHARILCGEAITIGDGVAIAWDVELLDDDRHRMGNRPRTAPIRIGDRVWIGHDVSIGKGVSIGEGAIVASNSVVTEDVPAETLVAGCPASVRRTDVEWS